MASPRTTMPSGHGELLTSPPYAQWAELARTNARAAGAWDFPVCGVPIGELRALARHEAVERARAFSARLGVAVRTVDDHPGLVVATGHQPELYHPGIWVKAFLLQRLSEETGAAAVDVVVDSDGFEALEVHSPCLRPEVRVCRAYLAVGTTDGCYACTPVPSAEELETFCRAGAEHLSTLSAPAIGHHFSAFCGELLGAAAEARNVAELVTFARRRYEAAAGTDYLELPVTSMASSRSFAAFLAHIALDAESFAGHYNAALADFRERTGTRSAAQPFPDLRFDGDLVELPFWHLGPGRSTVWARAGTSRALVVDGEDVCELESCDTAHEAVAASPLKPAPKALALTMYVRMLVTDLFIHGVGGGRYDQVTDDVVRRFFGVEPPPFAVASLTMYLPLGARVVRDEEVESVAMALNRLKHNPDQMLEEIEFDSAEDRAAAVALTAEKAGLVAAIAAPGADKKALGASIRAANGSLAALMEPFERRLVEQLEELRLMQQASGILTDRTYPFCFWSPLEVADKAR
jgi:hypothetical protein